MSRGRHAPARHPWRRAGRILGDVALLFILIALAFAIFGACFFLLLVVALHFAD